MAANSLLGQFGEHHQTFVGLQLICSLYPHGDAGYLWYIVACFSVQCSLLEPLCVRMIAVV